MKKPSNVFAPLVIAGITVGFLASAYKYIFRNQSNPSNTASHTSDAAIQQNIPVTDDSHLPHDEK